MLTVLSAPPSLSQHLQPCPCEVAARAVPLLGHRISAGFPSPATDYVEEGLDLNDYLITRPSSTFLFSVKGDSMRGAGIEEGDKVVVDRSLLAHHDDIVVAVVNGEFVLKRLYRRGKRIELRPENPAYRPIVCKPDESLELWGVVTGVIRRYGRQGRS